MSTRFRRSIERQWTGTEQEVEASLRNLKKQYKIAQKELEGRLADLYARASEENLPSRRRLEAMLEEYKSRYQQLNSTTNRQIEKISERAYTSSFNSVTQAISEERAQQIAAGVSSNLTEANMISFSRLSDEAILKSVQSEVSGTKLHDRLLKNTRDNWFKIRESVTQGIIRGDSYSRLKREVAKHYDDEYWKAARVVRTETHRTMTEGHLAAYDRAEARGIEMKRMWVSATDSRTRDRHSRLNETYADEEGFFEIDGMKARGPSQFGHASMDINCRCRVIGEIQEPEEAAQEAGENKPESVVFDAKTSKDAEAQAVTAGITKRANYKGLSPEVANKWNTIIDEQLRKYPALRKNFQFIGNAHERNKFYKPIRTRELIQDQNWKSHLTGDRRKRAAEFWVRRECGVVGRNTIAQAFFGEPAKGICLNKVYGQALKQIDEVVKRNVSNQWFQSSAKGIEHLAYHEFGHMMDNLVSLRRHPEFKNIVIKYRKKDIRKELGGYAQREGATEWIAEGWAEYLMADKPRPLAKEIGDLIQRLYKEKYGG